MAALTTPPWYGVPDVAYVDDTHADVPYAAAGSLVAGVHMRAKRQYSDTWTPGFVILAAAASAGKLRLTLAGGGGLDALTSTGDYQLQFADPLFAETIPLNSSTVRPRRYVLDSGDAIATYCPADGSVVPVAVGDRLYHGATGLYLTATLCGATMRWLGPAQSNGVQTTISASASYQISYPVPAEASGIWHTYWEGNLYVGAPNDVGNSWNILMYSNAVLIDSINTWTTYAMDAADMYRMRRALNIYRANFSDGGKLGAGGGVTFDYLNRTKSGAPGALFGTVSFAWHAVYA
jgi:hypothetical protein